MNQFKKKQDMMATGKGFKAMQEADKEPVKLKSKKAPIDIKAVTEAAFAKARTDLKVKQLNKMSEKNKK